MQTAYTHAANYRAVPADLTRHEEGFLSDV